VKYLFSDNESYKHLCSKIIVYEWINERPELFNIEGEFKTYMERNFFYNGFIYFIPDITVISECKTTIIEILHKHEVDGAKINKIQLYAYINKIEIDLFEINAEWILNQIDIPEKIISNKIII